MECLTSLLIDVSIEESISNSILLFQSDLPSKAICSRVFQEHAANEKKGHYFAFDRWRKEADSYLNQTRHERLPLDFCSNCRRFISEKESDWSVERVCNEREGEQRKEKDWNSINVFDVIMSLSIAVVYPFSSLRTLLTRKHQVSSDKLSIETRTVNAKRISHTSEKIIDRGLVDSDVSLRVCKQWCLMSTEDFPRATTSRFPVLGRCSKPVLCIEHRCKTGLVLTWFRAEGVLTKNNNIYLKNSWRDAMIFWWRFTSLIRSKKPLKINTSWPYCLTWKMQHSR